MYVKTYPKNSSNKKVSAHLRLSQHQNHEEDCHDTVAGAVRQIVAESKAVEGNLPILEEKQDKSIIFRLNFLEKAQRIIKAEISNKSNTERESIGADFIKSGQEIESYFRSAAGVARIRLLMENEELDRLTDLVKIQYKDSAYS